MRDSVQVYRETCHCGHDKCSHFDKADACLCSGCACHRYVNEHDPKPPTPRHSTMRPPTWDDF